MTARIWAAATLAVGLLLASAPSMAAILLSADFSKSFHNGTFGPFLPTEAIVIMGTVRNISADQTITVCEGLCLGDANTYAVGALTIIPNGYAYNYGNSPDNTLPFDGQINVTLLPTEEKDYVFGEYTPIGTAALGWHPFAVQLQIFAATVERPLLTTSTFYGNFEVIEATAPEPATLALAALGLTALGFTRRRRK